MLEIEDDFFLNDDLDIIDIFDFGFPRRNYERSNYFEDMDELSFFRRFRLTKNTVFSVLEHVEEELEFDNNFNNSLSPINQLLLTLRFYASDGHQISLGDFMGCHQSTVSRIICKVSAAIARLRPLYIKMPEGHQIIHKNQEFYAIAGFPKVLGCIDGTHIKIQSPGGPDGEIYRNRKGYFSINTQVIGDAKLKIQDIVARWPGSSHDQTIFNNSRICARFDAGAYENCVLLGDGGYALKNYLLTPVLNPNTGGQQLYNQAQIKTRNSVERLFGVWKRRFPILAYGLRCKLQTTLTIIVAAGVLHNIARDMNEPLPPPPDNINIEILNYLINQGQIPDVPPVAAPARNRGERIINYREELINNFFANQ